VVLIIPQTIVHAGTNFPKKRKEVISDEKEKEMVLLDQDLNLLKKTI